MQPDFDARSEQLLYRYDKSSKVDEIRFQSLGDMSCEVLWELIARLLDCKGDSTTLSVLRPFQ